MSHVRCPHCAEIANTHFGPNCPGCGNELPTPPSSEALRPGAAPAEARRDAGASVWVLRIVGVMIAGAIALALDNEGWPPVVAGALAAAIVAAVFVGSRQRRRVSDRHSGAVESPGIGAMIVKIILVFLLGATVIVVGGFVLLYLLCLAQGGFKF